MTSADMVRFADAVDGRSVVPALLSPHPEPATRRACAAPASANRPQVCSPAPHCRAVDPKICLTTAWAEDRRRSLAA